MAATRGSTTSWRRSDQRAVPTRAIWDVAYRDVDLPQLTDFLETARAFGSAGRVDGPQPSRLGARQVGARSAAAAKSPRRRRRASTPMTRELEPRRRSPRGGAAAGGRSVQPARSLGYLPIAGHVAYTLDPEWITLGPSWVATPKTYVEFEGRTAYGERSQIPFHVTSLDWLESDRVLAGIMTAFGSPTGAVAGRRLGAVRRRHARLGSRSRGSKGTFTRRQHARVGHRVGPRHGRRSSSRTATRRSPRASSSTDGLARSTRMACSRSAIPRKDGGEEINARIFITQPAARRSAARVRARRLSRSTGSSSGEYHLYGKYETPFGFGRLMIDGGIAYGETVRHGDRVAAVRRIGRPARRARDSQEHRQRDRRRMGRLGRQLLVRCRRRRGFRSSRWRRPRSRVRRCRACCSSRATGTGTFDVPRYDVRVRVDDLFAGDEGIGQLTGRLSLRGELLTVELEAASPRLVDVRAPAASR